MGACSLYDSIGEIVKGLLQCPMSHELDTFSRLLYRNKNQHRRDRYFQKLVRICKDSKKYQDLKLTEKFKSLQRLLAKYKFNLSSSSSGKIDYQCDAEIQNSISQLVQQTSQCTLLVKKSLEFCEDTFLVIRQHYLTLGLFVPFNLMMCAILSRLWTYLKYHANYLSQAHVILTQDHDGKIPDIKHVTTQPADVGEMVTLGQDFMQSRAKDFHSPAHVQPMVVANEVKDKKLTENNTKPETSYKKRHKTNHRWRNTINSSPGHFCGECWARSKRTLVRKSRKNRRNAPTEAPTSVKKKINRKYISAYQGTGKNFIDNIFSLIE